MKTPFGNTSFAGIGYGAYADIMGRPYEIAFHFLLSHASRKEIRPHYAQLAEALRTCYPFETVGKAWNDVTGDERAWGMLHRFFELNRTSVFSDDTVMTAATIDGLARSESGTVNFGAHYWAWGNKYPGAGYSAACKQWLATPYDARPYGTTSNGCIMRVSPIGFLNIDEEEALAMARASAKSTHDSNEAPFAAQVLVETIWQIRRCGTPVSQACLDALEKYFEGNSWLPKVFPIDRFEYGAFETLRHSLALLGRHLGTFEDLLRSVMKHGGDTDTIGMICGCLWGADHRSPHFPDQIDQDLNLGLPHEIKSLLLD